MAGQNPTPPFWMHGLGLAGVVAAVWASYQIWLMTPAWLRSAGLPEFRILAALLAVFVFLSALRVIERLVRRDP